MPELAEVAFHAKAWSDAIGGNIERVFVNDLARCCRELDQNRLSERLLGRSLLDFRTHGKRMLFEFSGGIWLGVHLGMTGKLENLDRGLLKRKHDHFVFETKGRVFAFNDSRQFGKIELFESEHLPDFWLLLPPAILDAVFDRALFEDYCNRRSRRPLKAFLLLQECFPGVGNWMADEILWQSRLAPSRKVEDLSKAECDALFKSIKFVCQGAMDNVAVDYSDPPENWLFRHRWKPGEICPQTGRVLARETIGGRTTCWSPDWQK